MNVRTLLAVVAAVAASLGALFESARMMAHRDAVRRRIAAAEAVAWSRRGRATCLENAAKGIPYPADERTRAWLSNRPFASKRALGSDFVSWTSEAGRHANDLIGREDHLAEMVTLERETHERLLFP